MGAIESGLEAAGFRVEAKYELDMLDGDEKNAIRVNLLGAAGDEVSEAYRED